MSEQEIETDIIETIPFYPRLNSIPRNKRAPKAMRILKEKVARLMKVELENILIDEEVNKKIWSRGIQKPPRRIDIRAVKAEDGVVDVYLASDILESRAVVQAPVSSKPLESDIDEDEEEEEEEE